jgi:hypothetical protein
VWLACVAVLLLVTGELLRRAMLRYDFTEPKLAEALSFTNKNFDILYFGDSLVLEGVDPSVIDTELATHSYNMALGGGSFLESEALLRHYLARNSAPKVAVIGVYVNSPESSSELRPTVYFALDRALRNSLIARTETEGVKPPSLSFYVFNRLPAYRYRNTIDLWIKSLISSQDQRPHFVQGQAQVDFSNPPNLGPVHQSQLNVTQLRHLIELCQGANISALLVEMPNHPGFDALTADRAQKLETLEGLSRQAGVPFVSFSDMRFEHDEWVNLNHLRRHGAARFSRVLAAWILAHKSVGASRMPSKPAEK